MMLFADGEEVFVDKPEAGEVNEPGNYFLNCRLFKWDDIKNPSP
jgi:hypothetical protein